MRKFKTNKNEVSDEIVKKKFEEDLKEIKDKLNAENLSDEFMEKLNARLEEELNKDTTETKGKVINFPVISRKLAGICACFILFFSSCFAFADDIENVIFEIFGNTDKIVENAIEKGNYKEIDMEYVEDNGVSIKVDYVAVEDDNLYIAFNVLVEDKFDKIYFDNIVIKDQNNYTIVDKQRNETNSTFIGEERKINNRNSIIINQITELKDELLNVNMLKIKLNRIKFFTDDEMTYKDGNWELKIEI